MKKAYKATELMPHVTRKELFENFDKWLDKVDREEIGIVITDDDKEDLVLCPAKWFDITLDDDFGCMVNCAVRYALGRESYMPGTIMNYVKRYLSIFDLKTIAVMIEDIEKYVKPYDKSIAYIDEWLELVDMLKEAGKKYVQKED